MTEMMSVADHGRRVLLRRFAAGATVAVLVPVLRARRAGATEPTVSIDNFTFSPTPLTIAPGATVTWVNQDDIPHSIYCQSLNLRSHPMDTSESFAHRFDQPGTFDYICGIHPHMRGRIVVQG
ncbi:MAG TPA: cupredoxin family copper-binding protein [Acetobacteraceae bacterium]|jgi:plastocyanin|nr:cupredoxin family copper-binding protein [Acetobacteraceae bacterium]